MHTLLHFHAAYTHPAADKAGRDWALKSVSLSNLTYRRSALVRPARGPVSQGLYGVVEWSFGPSISGVLATGDARACANGCGAKVAKTASFAMRRRA